MPPDTDKSTQNIKTLAEGLPFKPMDLPQFKASSFEPESIRQPRTMVSADSSSQAVGRFLAERGVVDILQPEMTEALFVEMHWCCWRIRKMAMVRYKTPKMAREALIEARRLVSRLEAAEEEVFIANRRLIVACVKPFFWVGQVWLSDFLQEGSKALSNAIRKFDHTRGTPFYAYAQKAIQNRLRNYFRDHIRSGVLGVRPSEEMIRIKQIVDKWKEEHAEEPPLSVLSCMAGVPEEKILRLRPLLAQWERMPLPPISLDALAGESDSSLHELIEDTDALQASDEAEKSEVWAAVDRLPERSARILRMRFMEGRTLEETGDVLQLTRARIKQIQDEALIKLRKMLRHAPGRGEDE